MTVTLRVLFIMFDTRLIISEFDKMLTSHHTIMTTRFDALQAQVSTLQTQLSALHAQVREIDKSAHIQAAQMSQHLARAAELQIRANEQLVDRFNAFEKSFSADSSPVMSKLIQVEHILADLYEKAADPLAARKSSVFSLITTLASPRLFLQSTGP